MVLAIGFQRLQIRRGLAQSVPVLAQAELGWDIDTYTLRVGDETSTPPRVLTTKSVGVFDFSAASALIFPSIRLKTGSTIDGVNLQSLNAGTGIVVRTTLNEFKKVSFSSEDGSIVIVNKDGTSTGTINLRVNPDIFPTDLLSYVSHDETISGLGTIENPLGIVSATTTRLGGIRIATQQEVDAGASTTTVITPSTLINLSSGNLVTTLRNLIGGLTSVNHGSSLSGDGAESPLEIVPASETQIGGSVLASQASVNDGESTNAIVTPDKLLNMGEGQVATALRALIGGLQSVSHSSSFGGSGTGNAPLLLANATTTLVGGVKLATVTEVSDATGNGAITPTTLAGMVASSTMSDALLNRILPNTGSGSLIRRSGQISWSTYLGTAPFLILEDAYTSGGLAMLSVEINSNTWYGRPYATIRRNVGGIATISNGKCVAISIANPAVDTGIGGNSTTNTSKNITLPPGTYHAKWWCAGSAQYSCVRTRLLNATDNLVIAYGSTSNTQADMMISHSEGISQGTCVFTLAVSKTIRIEQMFGAIPGNSIDHWCFGHCGGNPGGIENRAATFAALELYLVA